MEVVYCTISGIEPSSVTLNEMLTHVLLIFDSIASLYTWRYKKLGSLPHVFTYPEYQLSNAGFEFDYQLINVEDFNGVGESEPNPYFYQVNFDFIMKTCPCNKQRFFSAVKKLKISPEKV